MRKFTTQIRRAIQRQADETNQQLLKGSCWILVKKRAKLSPTEVAQFLEILKACPRLRTVYLLKEEFRTICEKAKDRQQAERFLRIWL